MAAVDANTPDSLRRLGKGAVSRATRRRRIVGSIIVLPALAVVVGVMWVPTGQALYYGFTDWNGVTAHWIGFSNYRSFVATPEFRQVLLNNVLLLLVLPVLVLGPLAMALVLNRIHRGRAIFRILLFAPVPLSATVVGIAGTYVFAAGGSFNTLLRAVGLGTFATDWLGHGASAMAALLILIVWSMFGVNFLIYLSAVSSFDETLFDAAKVDGAGPVRTYVSIVLPVLSPFVRFVTIYTATLMYTSLFGLIYVFSNGGPGYSTTTLEFFTYYQGFDAGQFAIAAAAGTVLLVIVFIINIPPLRQFLRSR